MSDTVRRGFERVLICVFTTYLKIRRIGVFMAAGSSLACHKASC